MMMSVPFPTSRTVAVPIRAPFPTVSTTSCALRAPAAIGANATVVCGATLGEYAFVGAGAVVTKDVKSYALVTGVPARQVGWMCRCGERLETGDAGPGTGVVCGACGTRYSLQDDELKLAEAP